MYKKKADVLNLKNTSHFDKVNPKKHLGQHFLKDLKTAERIVDLLTLHQNYQKVLEIGPGMGVLTQYLLQKDVYETYVVEIDTESVEYLNKNFVQLKDRIFSEDFLKMNLAELFQHEPFGIIGNFPYNISSQIFFKVLEYKEFVPEIVCMLQKEVAQRIASPPGNKDYGILSVLLQAFYDIDYGFTVLPGAFNPPPKVDSGVIRLRRNTIKNLACDEKKFILVVKTAFNQRRKTLRNALSSLGLKEEIKNNPIFDLRAERLSVADFVKITQMIF